MLHLIFQSPVDDALLGRIAMGDEVVFLENAVFQLNSGCVFSKKLQQLLDDRVFLYVLQEEVETRGIDIDESVSVIDYTGLVKLTEKNKIIKTWN